MRILKAFCIAFSLYSRIPVPLFEWKEEDMAYSMIFFPWVGIVIGALTVLWSYVAELFGMGQMATVLILAAIPIIVTGGFHVDGYMDTMDAFHSYKPKEEKLKILKDAHIGAFSVISLVLLGMIYIAAVSEIKPQEIYCYAGCFVFARALSGLTVLTLQTAKKDGIVHSFSSASKGGARTICRFILVITALLSAVYMLIMNLIIGAAMIAMALLVLLYYVYKTGKELGGVTGDTSGYFLCLTEVSMAVAAAACCVLM